LIAVLAQLPSTTATSPAAASPYTVSIGRSSEQGVDKLADMLCDRTINASHINSSIAGHHHSSADFESLFLCIKDSFMMGIQVMLVV
jgi:hypothetical protein